MNPKDHQPIWQECSGKEPFASAALANRVAKRRNTSKKMRSKGPSRRLEAYRCRHCGFFHLGGQAKKV